MAARRSCYNPVDDASPHAHPRAGRRRPVALPRRALYRTLRSWLRPRHPLLSPGGGGRRAPAPRGPYIIAANHHNYLDGVVLGLAVPEPIAFIVMPRVYRATLLHRPFHDRIGSIPINLERPDVAGCAGRCTPSSAAPSSASFPRGPSACAAGWSAACPGWGCSPCARGCPSCPRRSGEPTRPCAAGASISPAGARSPSASAPRGAFRRGRARPPGARRGHPAHHGRHRRPAGSLRLDGMIAPRIAPDRSVSDGATRTSTGHPRFEPGARSDT